MRNLSGSILLTLLKKIGYDDGVHIEVEAKAIHDWMERPLSTSKKLGYKCSILCLKSHDMFRL